MRKTSLILAVSIPAMVLATWWLLRPAHLREVETVRVEPAPMEAAIRVTGRVINDRTVLLTALLNGQIQGMQARKGDDVEQGQVVARLDPREVNVSHERAEAIVARERQAVDEAMRKLDRLRNVQRVGGEATQVIEDTEAALRSARARLRVAEADQRVAQIYRDNVEIKAPFAGIITEKFAEVGQWLEAGDRLYTLVAHSGREIEANVDAADSGAVRLGQTVRVTCDAFPGQEWIETVHWISPVVVSAEREALNTFSVRTTLGPDAPPLLLGQQLDLRIQTARREAAIKVPYTAVQESERGTRVAVVREGRVRLVPVVTGVEDLTHVEVLEGLTAGAEVILPEGKALGDGEPVRVRAR
jgi:RND family efflux transporter MFP subunit